MGHFDITILATSVAPTDIYFVEFQAAVFLFNGCFLSVNHGGTRTDVVVSIMTICECTVHFTTSLSLALSIVQITYRRMWGWGIDAGVREVLATKERGEAFRRFLVRG